MYFFSPLFASQTADTLPAAFFLLYEHGYKKSRRSAIYYSTASARTSSYLARICFSILMRISLLIG